MATMQVTKHTCPSRVFSLCQLIDGQHASLLRRFIHIGLYQGSPLLRLAPIYQHHIPTTTTSRRRRRRRRTIAAAVVIAAAAPRVPRLEILGAAVLAHKVDDLADVGRREAAVERAVEEEVRLGGGGEGEAEDAVVARVGEDEGGPFGELGVVDGQVGLAGEEGGEEVFAGEGEVCGWRGGGGGHCVCLCVRVSVCEGYGNE